MNAICCQSDVHCRFLFSFVNTPSPIPGGLTGVQGRIILLCLEMSQALQNIKVFGPRPLKVNSACPFVQGDNWRHPHLSKWSSGTFQDKNQCVSSMHYNVAGTEKGEMGKEWWNYTALSLCVLLPSEMMDILTVVKKGGLCGSALPCVTSQVRRQPEVWWPSSISGLLNTQRGGPGHLQGFV